MVRAVMEQLTAFFYEKESRSGTVIKGSQTVMVLKDISNVTASAVYRCLQAGLRCPLVNCLVHIRRHFEQALEENRRSASWFLRKIQELYHIEHELTGPACLRSNARLKGSYNPSL